MTDTTNTSTGEVGRLGWILLALAQGIMLYALYLSTTEAVWPATDLRWLYGLYAVALGLPGFFYLGLERWRDRRNLWPLLGLTPVLFWVGAHIGWQDSGELGAAASLALVVFILALFFRCWCLGPDDTGRVFRFERMLALSWQQCLVLALLGLFLLVFWLLLMLCAALFNAVGVSWVESLFEEAWFIHPVSALIGGWGLALIRERVTLLAAIRSVCDGLIRALLPLAALIHVLFLAALPFVGLEQVWQTGHASALMMSLTLVVLFGFNAVFTADDGRLPYPQELNRAVLIAVALLPVYSVLAAWSLSVRVEQYGLSVDRLWAAVLQLLIAGFTLGYALLMMWRRARALTAMHALNRGMALVVVLVLLAVNTPIADLRAWAASSQSERLLSGEVSGEVFDFDYLRFDLGTYGMEALQRLQAAPELADDDATLARLEASLGKESRWAPVLQVDASDMAEVAGIVTVIPQGAQVPDAILAQLAEFSPFCLHVGSDCQLVKVAGPRGELWLEMSNGADTRWLGNVFGLRDGKGVMLGEQFWIGCRDRGDARSLRPEQLSLVPGSVLLFGDGDCALQVKPTPDYLRELLPAVPPSTAESEASSRGGSVTPGSAG